MKIRQVKVEIISFEKTDDGYHHPWSASTIRNHNLLKPCHRSVMDDDLPKNSHFWLFLQGKGHHHLHGKSGTPKWSILPKSWWYYVPFLGLRRFFQRGFSKTRRVNSLFKPIPKVVRQLYRATAKTKRVKSSGPTPRIKA